MKEFSVPRMLIRNYREVTGTTNYNFIYVVDLMNIVKWKNGFILKYTNFQYLCSQRKLCFFEKFILK